MPAGDAAGVIVGKPFLVGLERGDDVVFLHAVVEGGADRSYGVHVARLAGVPERVTRRASALLRDLELNPPHRT